MALQFPKIPPLEAVALTPAPTPTPEPPPAPPAAVNVAPAGTNTTVTVDEDLPHVFTAANFGFTDTDGDSLQSVVIVTLPAVGFLLLNGVAVTAGQEIQATQLGSLIWSPPGNGSSGTALTSFTFKVRDTGGTADGGIDLDPTSNTLTFNVTAVNDPPANAMPASWAVIIGSPVNLTGLSVSDQDASTLTVTLSVPSGTIAATTGGGVTVAGSGTGTLTLTGSPANLNTFLGGVNVPVFTPSIVGVVTLTMTTSDGTLQAITSRPISVTSLTPTAPPPPAYVAPYGQTQANYPTMTFREEFDGAVLDTTKFIEKEPWWGPGIGELNNYAIENSLLKIWLGRKADGSFEFLNRAINTTDKFRQKYGYFEIRARLPIGIGCWPSFWLYGYDHGGGATTEIDIMEAYTGGGPASYWSDANYHPISYGGTVWYGQYDSPTMIGNQKLRDSLLPNGVDLSAAFHYYGCRWDSTGVRFYFDGQPIGPTIAAVAGLNDDPLTIIVAMGPGDAARPTAGIPTNETVANGTTIADKSNSYEVDYIRCWSLLDGSTVTVP